MVDLGFRPGRKRFWFAGIFGLVILYVTVRQANITRLLEGLSKLSWCWVMLVASASFLSYFFIALVLYLLLKNTGCQLSFSKTFRISTASCTLNYLLGFAGISGVAAKVYLLSRERISPSRTLSISMVHGFLTNTIAIVLIYLGFFSLYSNHKMRLHEAEIGVVVLILALLLTWITIQIIVKEDFRRKLWQISIGTARFICAHLGHPEWLSEAKAEAFFQNFDESMKLLMRNSRRMFEPALYALFDWVFMFLCLFWSFRAINYPVTVKVALVGFSVAIFASLFSFTPAGIGIMEGSMAGSFYLLGLDYDRTLLAVFLYRFFYYILPLVISFLLYRRLLSGSQRLYVQVEPLSSPKEPS